MINDSNTFFFIILIPIVRELSHLVTLFLRCSPQLLALTMAIYFFCSIISSLYLYNIILLSIEFDCTLFIIILTLIFLIIIFSDTVLKKFSTIIGANYSIVLFFVLLFLICICIYLFSEFQVRCSICACLFLLDKILEHGDVDVSMLSVLIAMEIRS
jgi:hypothetical protein